MECTAVGKITGLLTVHHSAVAEVEKCLSYHLLSLSPPEKLSFALF